MAEQNIFRLQIGVNQLVVVQPRDRRKQLQKKRETSATQRGQ